MACTRDTATPGADAADQAERRDGALPTKIRYTPYPSHRSAHLGAVLQCCALCCRWRTTSSLGTKGWWQRPLQRRGLMLRRTRRCTYRRCRRPWHCVHQFGDARSTSLHTVSHGAALPWRAPWRVARSSTRCPLLRTEENDNSIFLVQRRKLCREGNRFYGAVPLLGAAASPLKPATLQPTVVTSVALFFFLFRYIVLVGQ